MQHVQPHRIARRTGPRRASPGRAGPRRIAPSPAVAADGSVRLSPRFALTMKCFSGS